MRLARALYPALGLVAACGLGDDGAPDPYFGPQAFSDRFETGTPGPRWGCDMGGCQWQVVPASPIAHTAGDVAAGAGANYVFQSPDPQALDLTPQGPCQAFTAHFAAAGTFGFDYFISTAGPLGVQSANVLEVRIGTSTVQYDANFRDYIPIDTQWETALSQHGQVSGRYQRELPPGYYSFEFCYRRTRTVSVTAPDFVQVDNVETCVGTSCFRPVQPVARCTAEQGETLVPNLSSVPSLLFAVSGTGPSGRSSPYILIMNAAVLDFLLVGLNPADPSIAELQQHIEGVRTDILVDARTCDSDARRYVRLQMTETELVDFILANYEVNTAFIYVYLAVKSGWTLQRSQEMIQAFIITVTRWKTKALSFVIPETPSP